MHTSTAHAYYAKRAFSSTQDVILLLCVDLLLVAIDQINSHKTESLIQITTSFVIVYIHVSMYFH